MTNKPSIPFAETVELILRNAGIYASPDVARHIAMAVVIKFQETQEERDTAIWNAAVASVHVEVKE